MGVLCFTHAPSVLILFITGKTPNVAMRLHEPTDDLVNPLLLVFKIYTAL